MFEKDLKNGHNKKIFIVAGELSGDKTAAWFVQKIKQQGDDIYFEAVGGNFLSSCGVKIYERFEKLNIVGIFEIIRHLPYILRFAKQIINHIKNGNFQEVVLVDFPGFNLRLAKKLKQYIPDIKITYLAPPQLWCWGAWRAKKLKKYCDKIIVLYPFEVEWYAKRGITVEWIGNPVYDDMKQYFELTKKKEKLIALIPGSRISEIRRFMPLISRVIKLFGLYYPDAKFVLPIAESVTEELIQVEIRKHCINQDKIKFLKSEHEKFEGLAKCCLAITKPGTVTLELALLEVPAVVFFKISWLTYIIGRPLIKVRFMALPNLLVNYKVYQECIQNQCTSRLIFGHARKIYQDFLNSSCGYKSIMTKLNNIRTLLKYTDL